MFTDTLFVQQSLTNHLFYLRTIKEFCLNIALSFFQNEQDYITTASNLIAEGDSLLQEALELSDGKVLESALVNNIFVTQFTLPCEELTQKLFDITLNTNLTKEQLQLKASTSFEITEELLTKIDSLNQEALRFTQKFMEFASHIYIALKTNQAFSYSYPTIFTYMINTTDLYYRDLLRLINKNGVDPIFIINYGFYFSQSLRTISKFIIGLSDVNQNDIIQRASFFENEFAKFMSEYQTTNINPNLQKDIITREIKIVTDFQKFLEEILTGILQAELYFIVEPIFFDNIYTEVNYFLYLLKGSLFGQQKNRR